MNKPVDVQRIAVLLSDPTSSEDPRRFQGDSIAAGKAGLYSWWADAVAEELFLRMGGVPLGQFVYVGQAGATLWPSGKKSTATLKSRIRRNHIRGNASSSTFRHTISAILREPLNLRLAGPGKLIHEDNRRLSRWIEDHLRVTIVPWEDRDSLKRVEQAVLDALDPPFNLDGRPASVLRRRLTDLRRAITKGEGS